jgi:hypothetical protein
MFHFYDPFPKTDDVTASVAVNECQNCGKACETLTYLEGWHFNACDQCAEEAAREDAREAAELRKPCVNCKTRLSRWDSLYCSDHCKAAFLYFPEVA